jgi:hypothetical protein
VPRVLGGEFAPWASAAPVREYFSLHDFAVAMSSVLVGSGGYFFAGVQEGSLTQPGDPVCSGQTGQLSQARAWGVS